VHIRVYCRSSRLYNRELRRFGALHDTRCNPSVKGLTEIQARRSNLRVVTREGAKERSYFPIKGAG